MPPAELISIVITTYNRSDALAVVLRALALQDDKHFEVVIADDGSTELHRNALAATAIGTGLRIKHVWHPDVGFTAGCARNRGVSATVGDYIVLLDGDCVPETDFVRQHRKLREPGCFVNGSRVMLSPLLTQQVIAGEESLTGRNAGYWLYKRFTGDASKLTGLLRFPDFDGRKHRGFVWKGIRSCNMGVWRADYEAINGFDESFVGWGHEDADFVLRLHNHGSVRKNGFCATEVYHLWHTESSRAQESVNAQKVRERMRTGEVLPTLGYRESRNGQEVQIRTLG
ncbi:MAG TPA: glycosyltransferase family 2 protein [Rhodoferax sp.]|nr:glycosyltransferase family 2 protein [Rhodoferax sp.]